MTLMEEIRMLPEPTTIKECAHCRKSVAMTSPPPERMQLVTCPYCTKRFWRAGTAMLEHDMSAELPQPDDADELMKLVDSCLEVNEPIPDWLLQEIEEACSECD